MKRERERRFSLLGATRAAVLVLGISAVTALVAPAAARAADDVDKQVRAGIQLRQQGRDREALETFQRAAAIQRQPRVVAQIGLAEQALGLWAAAAEHVEEALAAGDDEWIKKNRRSLEQAFDIIKGQVGRLELWGSPEQAEVLVNGRNLGKLGDAKRIWLMPEQSQLVVRADGFVELSRTIQVGAGDFKREHVELRAVSLNAVAPAAQTGGGAAAPPREADATLREKPAAPPESDDAAVPLTHKWWFWTLLGVAAVGAGVGAAVALSSGGGACDGVSGPCTVYKP